MISEIIIRAATEEDLPGAKRLLDCHRHELGFVVLPALRQALARGWLFVAEADDALVGVVDWWARRDGIVVLYNIAVSSEARGHGVGGRLLETLVKWAWANEASAVRLKCPAELPSNAFYQRQGFTLTGQEPGKRRPLNCWSLSHPTLVDSAPLT